MSRYRLLLASASPARLTTLRNAGIDPLVQVSNVDEDTALAAAHARAAHTLSPAEQVLVLARAKAEDVAACLLGAGHEATPARAPLPDFVIGCDSMFELGGAVHGKPRDPQTARERWHRMRGNSGTLHTGHWLVDLRTGEGAGATSEARVTFADASDAEIDAYIATEEPLRVAGAFTIDGLGGPFVERVDGDHHGVVGISLPLLRRLLAERGAVIPDFWD